MENYLRMTIRTLQYLVIPPGLTNASFRDMINHILKDLIDKDIVVYIGDILIYQKSIDKRNVPANKLRQRLAKNEFESWQKNVSGKKKSWNSLGIY
jgi:hypothetical protein